MRYVKAPPGWSYSDENPFTPDGTYGAAWSCFRVIDRDDDQYSTGKSGNGPFSARFGRRVDHLEARLADFLRYESAHGRTVILAFPDGVDPDLFVAHALAHTPQADVVRPEDPRVIVHSTTAAAWWCIRADGALKAGALLASHRTSPSDTADRSELVQYLLAEPPVYKGIHYVWCA